MHNIELEEILEEHRGGKISVEVTCSMETIADLRKIYTPGVAEVCRIIENDPSRADDLTMIGNTVCIATNGTAVLGLGDIGVKAAMPVMEGKSVILNKMSGVACMPILIDSRDADHFVEVLSAVSCGFSAVMLEDISAPLCFEIEKKMLERVNMPVFHDDQHGTACVVLAALIRALKKTGKKRESVRIVISGAGAAGTAICNLLFDYGFKSIFVTDKDGVLSPSRKNMNPYKKALAQLTNPECIQGELSELLKGADVFVGVSAPGIVTQDMVRGMNRDPIVLALANPVPEIEPSLALEAGAAVALDGKMVNNALVFPGLMRGVLDAKACRVTSAMKISAAEAVAAMCGDDEIVPDFMDKRLHISVAAAVRESVCK